jgi:hypothetical protein
MLILHSRLRYDLIQITRSQKIFGRQMELFRPMPHLDRIYERLLSEGYQLDGRYVAKKSGIK